MQIITEKIILNIGQLLELIDQIRKLAVLHDYHSITYEADRAHKNSAERNTHGI